MKPFLRLVILIAIVFVLALMGLRFLRWMGQNEITFTSNHPWMSRPNWLVARLSSDQCSQAGLKDLLTLDQKWLIWVDLQPDVQHDLHLVCPKSNIFDLDPNIALGPRLEEILPMLKGRGVIFNVRVLDASFTNSFLKTISDWAGKDVNIGVASPSQSFIRDLRKKEPDWLFAADSSTWSKLRVFEALGIESTIDLWPDFFVASRNPQDPNSFTLRLAREIQRRRKIVILECDESSDVPAEWKQTLRGILTNRPKKFPTDTFFTEMGAK